MSKKLIVLIEIVVCVMAIIVVSLFGLNPENWRDNVYATGIEFYENDVTLIDEKYQPTDEIKLQIVLDKASHTYQLKWRILPETATVKDVVFAFSGGIKQENGDVTDGNVTVTKDGLVVFSKEVKGLTITVSTTDGSNYSDRISIIPYVNQTGDLPLD